MAYDNLRAKLPEATAAKRVSKQTVLKLAKETSQAIQAKEANLKTQMTTLTRTHLLLQEKLADLQADQKPQQEGTQEPIVPQVTGGPKISPLGGKSAVKRKKKSELLGAGNKSKGPWRNKPIYSINSMEMAMAEKPEENPPPLTPQQV